ALHAVNCRRRERCILRLEVPQKIKCVLGITSQVDLEIEELVAKRALYLGHPRRFALPYTRKVWLTVEARRWCSQVRLSIFRTRCSLAGVIQPLGWRTQCCASQQNADNSFAHIPPLLPLCCGSDLCSPTY